MKNILLPLVENFDESHCTIVKVCLVKGKNLVKEMKEQHAFYSLIPRKTEKQELEHAPKIEPLLTEFQGIIFDNVPDDFPPMISIIHCMDLIPVTKILHMPKFYLNSNIAEENI